MFSEFKTHVLNTHARFPCFWEKYKSGEVRC